MYIDLVYQRDRSERQRPLLNNIATLSITYILRDSTVVARYRFNVR